MAWNLRWVCESLAWRAHVAVCKCHSMVESLVASHALCSAQFFAVCACDLSSNTIRVNAKASFGKSHACISQTPPPLGHNSDLSAQKLILTSDPDTSKPHDGTKHTHHAPHTAHSCRTHNQSSCLWKNPKWINFDHHPYLLQPQILDTWCQGILYESDWVKTEKFEQIYWMQPSKITSTCEECSETCEPNWNIRTKLLGFLSIGALV